MITAKRYLTVFIIMTCLCLCTVSMCFAETAVTSKDGVITKNGSAESTLSACFSHSSKDYDRKLALICAQLCKAAQGESNAAIEEKLAELGFENDRIFDEASYVANKKNTDTAGYSFAQRKINVGGETYNLIAVVIRGTYGNEWYSNFNIGEGGSVRSDIGVELHAGFSAAEYELEKNLDAYMKSISCSKQNTIILVTGHSRGAAVANILVYSLSKNEKYAPEKSIFAYTFACPNTALVSVENGTKPAEGIEENCGNIFNIVNPADFITSLPVSEWGGCRFGKDYALSVADKEKYAASENIKKEIVNLASGRSQVYSKKITTATGSSTMYEYFSKVAGVLSGSESPIVLLPYIRGGFEKLTTLLAPEVTAADSLKRIHGIEGYINSIETMSERDFLKSENSFVPKENEDGFRNVNYA